MKSPVSEERRLTFGRAAWIFLFLILAASCVRYQKTLPEEAARLNVIGIEHAEAGEFESAEEAFEKAIELAPGRPEGYNNLGRLYFGRKKYEEAVGAFRSAARYAPESTGILKNLGAALGRLGRYEEAEAAYRRALEIEPEDAGTHYELTVVLILAGKRKEAMEELEVLESYDPPLAHSLRKRLLR